MKIGQDKTAAVILAAGLGKRMKSDLPKVLHKLNGRALVEYVIDNVVEAGISRILVVIGHKHELVRKQLENAEVEFVLQVPQKGTGHAVQMAMPKLADYEGDLLVLYGDMPLISSRTINGLLQKRRQSDAAAVVLTVTLDDPKEYGRIVRDRDGMLTAIVEYKDADESTRTIREINTGTYCFDIGKLRSVIDRLDDNNAQREFYLTDVISIMKKDGLKVAAYLADNSYEGLGVNSIEELHEMERILMEQRRGEPV